MKNAVQTSLRDYVKSKGIKQRYISQATGLSEYCVSDIFCNRREMKADEFALICIAIEKSPDEFIGQLKKEE
jgi:transcriptional regulator with XRE-family HTH domain